MKTIQYVVVMSDKAGESPSYKKTFIDEKDAIAHLQSLKYFHKKYIEKITTIRIVSNYSVNGDNPVKPRRA